MEKKMKLMLLLLSCMMVSVSWAGDPGNPDCEENMLSPTGLIRDGYDTKEWLDSILSIQETKSIRTFGCDEVRMVVGDFPPKDGDYAYFINHFDWDPTSGFPEPTNRNQVKFEFTVLMDDLMNSFNHNDSFTLFRVFDDINDDNTVMLEINMIRQVIYNRSEAKGQQAPEEYWLAELTWNNLNNGSTLIQTHQIHGDFIKMNYEWNRSGILFSDETMTLEDKNGPVVYNNQISNNMGKVPSMNHLGLVGSSRVLSMGDEIIIRGPTPYPRVE
jgi:hypothetical protein